VFHPWLPLPLLGAAAYFLLNLLVAAMQRIMISCLSWFVLGLLLSGCNPAASPDADQNSPSAMTEPGGEVHSAVPALKPEEINLVVGDEKKLAEMIAAHKGEVVFVDYWATWCEPCVEYFPHTVEMHRKYKDQGLATIAVTFDEPEEESTAREFLAKHGADFENLLNAYGNGLYNRQGELVKKWDNQPPDADKLIEELLAEKAD
jgi:thiol-disulfide isomerase/thioredoxin